MKDDLQLDACTKTRTEDGGLSADRKPLCLAYAPILAIGTLHQNNALIIRPLAEFVSRTMAAILYVAGECQRQSLLNLADWDAPRLLLLVRPLCSICEAPSQRQ